MKKLMLVIGTLAAGFVFAQGLATAASTSPFPEVISLPDGFRPEGIVTGRGATIYAGSLGTGAIYQADLRTGQGVVLVPPQEGRTAVGLSFDKRTSYIYAAGGPTGSAYVYDGATGENVAAFQLSSAPARFINDVIVTRKAAYFTDSLRPVLYRLPLLPGGRLPDPSAVEEIVLSGDFEFVPDEFNSNGIEAASNGRALIIVNSTLGRLYRVDPASGLATQINLGDGTVPAGDGLLLVGRTLYVVQNRLNQVAVGRLDRGLTSGQIVEILTDPRLDVPTTIARLGASLYVVNARFTTPPAPDTAYTILKLR